MSSLGVYIELKDGKVKKTALELLTLAHQAGREAVAVLFANDPGACADDLAAYGAARIVHDEIPKLIEKPRIQGIVSRLRDSNGDTCGQVGVEVDE